MTPDQMYALRSPIDVFDPRQIVKRARLVAGPGGARGAVVLAVDR